MKCDIDTRMKNMGEKYSPLLRAEKRAMLMKGVEFDVGKLNDVWRESVPELGVLFQSESKDKVRLAFELIKNSDSVSEGLRKQAEMIENISKKAKVMNEVITVASIPVDVKAEVLAGYVVDRSEIVYGNVKYMSNPYIFLHEYVHAISAHTLGNNEVLAEKIGKILEVAKDGYTGDTIYGLTNIDELFAEYLANPEFRKYLETKYDDMGVIARLKRLIQKLLGLTSEEMNALEQLDLVSEEVVMLNDEYKAAELTDDIVKMFSLTNYVEAMKKLDCRD